MEAPPPSVRPPEPPDSASSPMDTTRNRHFSDIELENTLSCRMPHCMGGGEGDL